MSDVVWRPSADQVDRANVTRFMRAHGIPSPGDLLRRSREEPSWFWEATIHDLGIEFERPYEQLVDTSEGVEWARWFQGGLVNVASNCLDRWAERTPEALALVWEGEDGVVRRMTYAELRRMADRVARALIALGVERGDRVGIYMPMAPETVALVMGCAKVGAVCLPLFSGFGPDPLAARIEDAGARVLITADGFLRHGAVVPMKEIADAALELTRSVERVLVWPRLGRSDLPWDTDRDVRWADLVETQPDGFPTSPLDPESPFLILYTSGTTGRPKGAILPHGGFLVQAAKDGAYHFDVGADDTFSWVTDIGWIMGVYGIVIAGVSGATLFLFEGVPTHPSPDRLWEMVKRHRVSVLGVSPTLIRALSAAGSDPGAHDLSSLRILGGTGEPWNPEPYLWLLERVGQGRCPIINVSGGTEVGAAFLAPLPIGELKPCTLGGPALGMDVDVFDAEGRTVPPGEVGELVCKRPWPSMTRGIWRDPERYLDTYWRRWPGVWCHGDWASADGDGFWFLHGRSDDTLNVAGKRLGPAEVETVFVDHMSVAESAAVGVPHELKGEVIWCFVVLRPTIEPTPALAGELSALVAGRLGKAFRPDRVVFVDDLPRTRTAKILRRVIRATVLGRDPGDISSLENPSAVEEVRSAIAPAGGVARMFE